MAAAALAGTARAASGQWGATRLTLLSRKARHRTEWAAGVQVNRRWGSGDVVLSGRGGPDLLRGCRYFAAQDISETLKPSDPCRAVWLGVSASVLALSRSAFPRQQSRRTGAAGSEGGRKVLPPFLVQSQRRGRAPQDLWP